jgi:hypothetical protein
VRGSGDYNRKKKDTVGCLAGCAVCCCIVSVFGSGGKLVVFYCGGKFLLRPEKKKIQSSVWRVRDQLRPKKKKIQLSVCWVCGSGTYDRKKKDTVICLASCAVVLCQFLVLAGNRQFFCCGCLSGGCAISITTGKKKDTVVCLLGARFWRLRPEKKKIQSSVWRVLLLYCVSFWFWREIGSFFVVAGNFYSDRKKKFQSSVWRVRDHYYDRKKKDTVVCLLGARFWQLQPEKKDTVVCLAGCAVVSVFGSGGKLSVFLLWREITTGKKKDFLWRESFISTGKKNSIYFVVAEKFYYDRKKKVLVVIFTRNRMYRI